MVKSLYSCLLFSFLLIACEDDKKITHDSTGPFDFDSVNLVAGKYGKVIEASSQELDVVFIFSDGPQERYGLTSTVFTHHSNSCKLGLYSQSNDKYYFDFSGLIYLRPNSTGYEIELDVTGSYGSITASFTVTGTFAENSFEGITSRDEQGLPYAAEDPSDWNLISEPSLLERTTMNISGPILSDQNFDTQFYPNPANQIGHIRNIFDETYLCDYHLVTSDYGTVMRIDSISANQIASNFYHTAHAGELNRLYYKIYNDTEVYLGFGDIIINE